MTAAEPTVFVSPSEEASTVELEEMVWFIAAANAKPSDTPEQIRRSLTEILRTVRENLEFGGSSFVGLTHAEVVL